MSRRNSTPTLPRPPALAPALDPDQGAGLGNDVAPVVVDSPLPSFPTLDELLHPPTTDVALSLPLAAPIAATQYCGRHIELAQLTRGEAETIARLSAALDARGARLADGKHVGQSKPRALRWLLQAIHAAARNLSLFVLGISFVIGASSFVLAQQPRPHPRLDPALDRVGDRVTYTVELAGGAREERRGRIAAWSDETFVTKTDPPHTVPRFVWLLEEQADGTTREERRANPLYVAKQAKCDVRLRLVYLSADTPRKVLAVVIQDEEFQSSTGPLEVDPADVQAELERRLSAGELYSGAPLGGGVAIGGDDQATARRTGERDSVTALTDADLAAIDAVLCELLLPAELGKDPTVRRATLWAEKPDKVTR